MKKITHESLFESLFRVQESTGHSHVCMNTKTGKIKIPDKKHNELMEYKARLFNRIIEDLNLTKEYDIFVRKLYDNNLKSPGFIHDLVYNKKVMYNGNK